MSGSSTEPVTEAGREYHDTLHADDDPCTFGMTGVCEILDAIVAIERQAARTADKRMLDISKQIDTEREARYKAEEARTSADARADAAEREVKRLRDVVLNAHAEIEMMQAYYLPVADAARALLDNGNYLRHRAKDGRALRDALNGEARSILQASAVEPKP